MTVSKKDELLERFNSCYRFVTCYTPFSNGTREEMKVAAEQAGSKNSVLSLIMRFLTT